VVCAGQKLRQHHQHQQQTQTKMGTRTRTQTKRGAFVPCPEKFVVVFMFCGQLREGVEVLAQECYNGQTNKKNIIFLTLVESFDWPI
jgi:hypothetical protein